MSETNLEAILENASVNITWQVLNQLEVYLRNGGENLDLKQYKRIRQLADKLYVPQLQTFQQTLDYEQKRDFKVLSNKINRTFNDYLTDQHYKLMDELRIRHDEKVDRTISLNPRENQYKLERLMWSKQQNEHLEKQLIEKIPEQGLTVYKVNTLRRMQSKTNYFTKLRNKIMSYITGKK